MNKINDGGPAFSQQDNTHESGMTLRDYFAARALQAIIQGLPIRLVFKDDELPDAAIEEIKSKKIPGVVAGAYAYADEMLRVRLNQSAAESEVDESFREGGQFGMGA